MAEEFGPRGAAFWTTCSEQFEFSTAEVSLLMEVCRCLDRLEALAATITEMGPMVCGSAGQPVVNPALTEARGQQVVLHRLIAALKLPDASGGLVGTAREAAASTAATARWSAGPKVVA